MDKDQKRHDQKDEMNSEGRYSDQSHTNHGKGNDHDISKIDRHEGNMDHGETGDRQKQENHDRS